MAALLSPPPSLQPCENGIIAAPLTELWSPGRVNRVTGFLESQRKHKLVNTNILAESRWELSLKLTELYTSVLSGTGL